MKLLSNKFLKIALLTVIVFTISAINAEAARIATLTYFKGEVQVKRSDKNVWVKAQLKMPLYVSDSVKTLKKASAEILLDDGSVIRLKESSLMEIRGMSEDKQAKKSSFGVILGKVWTDVAPQAPGSTFELHGPSATVGVRGTRLAISVGADNEMRVLVFNGMVRVTSSKTGAASMMLNANQALDVSSARNLSAPQSITKEESDDWSDFVNGMENEKKTSIKGEIKYSIKATNSDGKTKETDKYAIPVKVKK
jgi:hypothetical protein